jgi:hypothetical protein
MKIVLRLASVVAALVASSAMACPAESYSFHNVSLDANGVVTRTEMREVNGAWQSVVVDKITLAKGDLITLNAAPGTEDADFSIIIKRNSQKADHDGVFFTNYAVREIATGGWGNPRPVEKTALVTIASDYLGAGEHSKDCGSVSVKVLPSPIVPGLFSLFHRTN